MEPVQSLSSYNVVDERSRSVAVLTDADNQAAVIDGLFAEVACFGESTFRRVDGDHIVASASCKKCLSKHSIKPVR